MNLRKNNQDKPVTRAVFTGTYNFREHVRQHAFINYGGILYTYFLFMEVRGKLTFTDDFGKEQIINIDESMTFEDTEGTKSNFHKNVIKRIKEGGVEKMFKDMIINKLKFFYRNRKEKDLEGIYNQYLLDTVNFTIEICIENEKLKDK